MKKYTVPMENQSEFESQKLWQAVTIAIDNEDQIAATKAKTILEEAQRERAKERKFNNQEWVPKYFVQVCLTPLFFLNYFYHNICVSNYLIFNYIKFLRVGYNNRQLDLSKC